MTDDGGAERPGYFVQSVARVMDVLKAFDAGHPVRTSADVAKETSLDRAAARRFLLTLADLGYVRNDDGQFSLRPRVLDLGFAYLSSLSLPEIVQPHIEALVSEVHETSSVGVIDSGEVVFVARAATQSLRAMPVMVGSRFHVYASSMGHVLLAGAAAEDRERYLEHVEMRRLTENTITTRAELERRLTQVREQGYAVSDREGDGVTTSMAVPLRAPDGATVAAINLSIVADGTSAIRVRSLLPALQRTASAIESDLAAKRGTVPLAVSWT